MKKRQRKTRLGDIIAIPLGDGHYGYGRVYRDASIGIFDMVSQEIKTLDDVMAHSIVFWNGFFETEVRNGNWLIIGCVVFRDNEDPWAPPQYIEDVLSPGKYQIYHRGKLRSATKAEVNGLEPQAIVGPQILVQRIREMTK